MTAIDDVLVSPGEAANDAATPPRRRIWPRIVGGFAIGFVLTVGVAAAALLAVDLAHEGRVLQGVQVGTVDLSGMGTSPSTPGLSSMTEGDQGFGEMPTSEAMGGQTGVMPTGGEAGTGIETASSPASAPGAPGEDIVEGLRMENDLEIDMPDDGSTAQPDKTT